MLKVRVNEACRVALPQLAHLLVGQEQKLMYRNISMAYPTFDEFRLNDPDTCFITRVLD